MFFQLFPRWLSKLIQYIGVNDKTRVVYCFDTGSLAGIGIDIPYTGTGGSVFRSVF